MCVAKFFLLKVCRHLKKVEKHWSKYWLSPTSSVTRTSSSGGKSHHFWSEPHLSVRLRLFNAKQCELTEKMKNNQVSPSSVICEWSDFLIFFSEMPRCLLLLPISAEWEAILPNFVFTHFLLDLWLLLLRHSIFRRLGWISKKNCPGVKFEQKHRIRISKLRPNYIF